MFSKSISDEVAFSDRVDIGDRVDKMEAMSMARSSRCGVIERLGLPIEGYPDEPMEPTYLEKH